MLTQEQLNKSLILAAGINDLDAIKLLLAQGRKQKQKRLRRR